MLLAMKSLRNAAIFKWSQRCVRYAKESALKLEMKENYEFVSESAEIFEETVRNLSIELLELRAAKWPQAAFMCVCDCLCVPVYTHT